MLSVSVFCTALPTRYGQLSNSQQYSCQGIEHNLHQILLNPSVIVIDLTLKCPCIANIILISIITNQMHLFQIIYFQNALHVSGGSSAHSKVSHPLCVLKNTNGELNSIRKHNYNSMLNGGIY